MLPNKFLPNNNIVNQQTVQNLKEDPKKIKEEAVTKVLIDDGMIEPEHDSAYIEIGPTFNGTKQVVPDTQTTASILSTVLVR